MTITDIQAVELASPLERSAVLPHLRATLIGAARDRLRTYTITHMCDSIHKHVNLAVFCREIGFTARKLHALAVPDRDIEECRAVRQAVGHSMDLVVDGHVRGRRPVRGVRRQVQAARPHMHVDLRRALPGHAPDTQLRLRGAARAASAVRARAGDVMRVSTDEFLGAPDKPGPGHDVDLDAIDDLTVRAL